MDDNFNPFEDDKDNINNPFANEDINEEFSNPFQAELKNDNSNNNNNKSNLNQNKENNNNNNDSNKLFNPYESNNNISNDDFNPYENKNSNNITKNDLNKNENNNKNDNTDPFEDNNNDNPFENNNENNPFNNKFEDNILNNDNNQNNNDNNNQRLPSFENFEESSFNPYQDNNNNNNNNFNNMNSNFNNNMHSNFNNNNNQGNNYLNNFGGPTDFPNNNIPPNPFGNNGPNNNYNNNNPADAKKIKAIMNTCITLYKQASNQYDNFNIREAIKTLCKSIKGLDGLKQTIINKKTSFNSLLPKITSLRNKAFSNLQEYRINIYQLINLKFKPVPYNDTVPLLEFTKRYLLCEPFISFDDIFDPSPDQNKKLKFVMNDYFKKSQRMGYKNFLLYGPRGSGKTLAVHALANDLKGKVAQIEGLELFQIPYFAKEFVKYVFGYMQFKPLIVYIKNMEKMFSNMINFNFLYDKTSSSNLQNVIFIASTTVPIQQLPKEISKKFHYYHCIRPADKSQKLNYIKFISLKIGIKINMSDEDLNSFAFQNLRNYSNEDIFNLIITAINLKKKEIGNDEENRVYKEGLNDRDIMNALKSVKGNLTPEVMKTYYL